VPETGEVFIGDFVAGDSGDKMNLAVSENGSSLFGNRHQMDLILSSIPIAN
jgi:hypothetical protein